MLGWLVARARDFCLLFLLALLHARKAEEGQHVMERLGFGLSEQLNYRSVGLVVVKIR